MSEEDLLEVQEDRDESRLALQRILVDVTMMSYMCRR